MPSSLRARLSIAFSGLTLLAVALFALVVAGVLERLLIERLSEDLEVQAYLVAGHVATDLAAGDIDAIQTVLTDLDGRTSARALIVDARRRQVAASEAGDRHALGLPSEKAGLLRALQGEPVRRVLERGRDDDELLYVAVPVVANGQVVGAVRLAYQIEDLQGTLDRLNLGIALGAVAIAIAAGLLALFFAASISAPIRALSRATQALAAGDLDQQVAVSGKDEVGQLGIAFNDLAARLAELETARRELAADVSHELRGLAGAMQTAIQALHQGASRDPDLERELMGGLTGHADRLVRLADDLRELGRVRSGWLSIQPEPVSLAVVARQAVSEWTAEAGRRHVRIGVDVSRDDPAIVDGDRDRLVQVCGNLIENALKYAANGGRIQVAVAAGEATHTLTVEDNGPGIPPSALPSIFRRSYRVEGRSSDGPGGMGLGLAIVDRVIRAHGGDVSASNAQSPAHGAVFTIRLPAYCEPAGREPVDDELAVHESAGRDVSVHAAPAADTNGEASTSIGNLARSS